MQDRRSHRRRFDTLQPLGQQGLHQLLEHVGPLTHQRALSARQFAHGRQHARNTPLLAQQAHPQFLQLGGARSGGDGDGGLGLQLRQLIGEVLEADVGAHGLGARLFGP